MFISLFSRLSLLVFFVLPNILLAGSSSDQEDSHKRTSTAVKQGAKKARLGETEDKKTNNPLNYFARAVHDIKNQLTGLSILDAIDQDRLHPEDLAYLKMAQASAQEVIKLATTVLEASRLESEHFTLSKEKLSPVAIAAGVIRDLSHEAKQKGVNLTLGSSLQDAEFLVGDSTRLRQVFFNLVHNALKFTPEGTVHLHLDGSLDEKQSFILRGEVVDTGIGMSADVLEGLFKPFSQANPSSPAKGTGLGLFITSQLCTLMNGDISVASEIGKGSTFRFHLSLDYVHP